MANEKVKREQPRLDEHSTIFIETLAASENSSQQESILICNSLEISASGVRVCVDDELETGALLRLGIELAELERPLYMVGEVRWCKPAQRPEQGYHVGFKLLESDGTDYEIWKKLVQEMI
ncbi:MAG: PilZ domain-containing protein [Gammaproteobacteria bacterium]|nr:PilZ domain-containing protein [Gammaproteobacteria bacterium]